MSRLSGYAGPHVAFVLAYLVLVGWFIHASSRAASFVRAAVCACTAIIVLCHVFMGAMCVSTTVSAAVYAHRETYPRFRIQQLQMQGCNQLIHIRAMWDVRFLLVTAVLCHAIITRTPQSTRPFALELSPAQSKGRGVHRFGGPCDRGGLHGPEILRRSRLSDRGGRAAALARFRAAQGAPACARAPDRWHCVVASLLAGHRRTRGDPDDPKEVPQLAQPLARSAAPSSQRHRDALRRGELGRCGAQFLGDCACAAAMSVTLFNSTASQFTAAANILCVLQKLGRPFFLHFLSQASGVSAF